MTLTILPGGSTKRPRSQPSPGTPLIAGVLALALAGGGTFFWLQRGGESETVAPIASAAKPAAVRTADQLIAEMNAAVASQAGEHDEVTGTVEGKPYSASEDIGPTSGIQNLTLTGKVNGHLEVRVVPNLTYITGDAAIMQTMFGFSTSAASKLAGKPLSLKPGDQAYAELTSGLTIQDLLKQLQLGGTLTLLPAELHNGVTVIGVQGTPTGPDTQPGTTGIIWIPAKGPALPESYVSTRGADHFTVVFSKWGTAVSVQPPSGAIAVFP